jgi:hypothetical protein
LSPIPFIVASIRSVGRSSGAHGEGRVGQARDSEEPPEQDESRDIQIGACLPSLRLDRVEVVKIL